MEGTILRLCLKFSDNFPELYKYNKWHSDLVCQFCHVT